MNYFAGGDWGKGRTSAFSLNTWCYNIGVKRFTYFIEYFFVGGCEVSHGVCPWWLGYLLASPLRRLLQDPVEIVKPYVEEGMTVLDVGCGMGFFSLPLANLVGEKGRVVCIDLQEKMIKGLLREGEEGWTDRQN